MARARKSEGSSVNLFPFLSILICIIGGLTMIIVILQLIAMQQVEGREPEDVERAREFVQMEKIKEEDQKKLDDLRQLIEEMIQVNQSTLANMERLRLLKDLLENQEKLDVSREELMTKFALLQQTNKQLDIDHTELLAQIEKLKKEIEERKLPPEAARLQVRPTGSGANTIPYFVEIASKTILIHHSLSEPPIEIPSASLGQSEEFNKLLETIKAAGDRRLIFLVRGDDSSMANLAKANSVVSSFKSRTGAKFIPGKLPLPGDGKVDLSLFAQYLSK